LPSGEAKVYLGVSEKSYRFTPFRMVGNTKPEVTAGCDPGWMPMAWLRQGCRLQWPVTLEAGDIAKL
jgi:hypothetical protein